MSRHSHRLASLTAFGFAMALTTHLADACGQDSKVEKPGAPTKYEERIRDFTEAIRLNPHCAENYLHRSMLWAGKREYDKQLGDLTEAIRLEPNYADAFRLRGMAWVTKKEYDKALKDFNEAIRLDPNDAFAFMTRGQGWFAMKEYGKALSDYTQAIRLDPNEPHGFLNRGNLWVAKKEYDRAIKDYDEAVRLKPNCCVAALALDSRGRAWSKMHDYARADKDFMESLRLAETLPIDMSGWLFRDYANFLATCPDAAFRDGKKAVEMARKSCALVEDGWQNWGSLSVLAAGYAEVGNLAEAVRWQRQALADTTLDAAARKDHEQRLKLYEANQPYREP